MDTGRNVSRTAGNVESFPLPAKRLSDRSNNFQTYCIKLTSLVGLNQGDNEIDKFHLQANLFDQVHRQFIGNTWIGKAVLVRKKQILINQNFYFYTSISGNELLLVIEVVSKSKTPGQLKTFGWISVSLFGHSNVENSLDYKVPLFSGSPIALYFFDEARKNDHADFTASQKTDVELSLSVSNHLLLMRIIHLLPENILFAPSDYIPGLVKESKEQANEIDFIYKPKLQKCGSYLLEKISIKVRPTIESADTELLTVLQSEKFEDPVVSQSLKKLRENRDLVNETEYKILKRLEKSKKAEKKASSSSKNILPEPVIPLISQRRLQIGVHNGFCFIQEPDIYHLLVEPVVTQGTYQPNRRSSSLGSLNYSREECLTLRSDIKVPNVPDDPNITFVFLVEYGITFQSSQKDQHQLTSPASKCPDVNLAIAWGSCKLPNLKAASVLNVPLTGDPYSCPFKIPFYNGDHNFGMALSVVPSTKQKIYSSSHIDVNQDKTSISTITDDTQSTVRPSNIFSSPSSGHSVVRNPRSFRDIIENLHKTDFGFSQSQQGLSVSELRSYDNNTLQEVAVVPSSMPLVPPAISSFVNYQGKEGVSSKYCFDEFQPIFDHHGRPATVLDSSLNYNVNKEKEIKSSPQINECIFQFLALTGLESTTLIPSQVFFTFQFYRFPSIKSERLTLKSVLIGGDSHSSQVYALHTSGNGEKSGYQVAYTLDPSEFENGEFSRFLLYLTAYNIHLDIWDAQSLLYFGTVTIPLKYFCRQGKEAVSTVLELDIIKSEFFDDSLGQATYTGHVSNGKLHIRLANIRHPLSSNSLKKMSELTTYSDSVVIKANRTSSESSAMTSSVSRAKPIAQTNRELSKLLTSRCVLSDTNVTLDNNLSEERRRKLARMEALRNMENSTSSNKSIHGIQRLIKERQRDLLNIELYIKKNKKEMIQSLLHSSITTEKTIYSPIGSITFFEFELENPFHVAKTVQIHWKCSEIDLVSDNRKWKVLRSRNNMSQNIESRMFSFSNDTFSVNLQPKEKVNIPFTYHCVSGPKDNVDSLQAVSGHRFTAAMLFSSVNPDNLCCSTAKISFQTQDNTILAVLNLKIQPIPAPVSHIFKFLTLENSTFKKSIRLSEHKANTEYSIECTDPEVVCNIQDPQEWNTSLNINLQAPSSAAGKNRTFYLFIYSDAYHLSLFQTWEVSVYPLKRLDLSCVAGQMMQTSFIVRGSHVTNLVKCSTNSMELQLHPSDPFILTAFSVQEITLNVRRLIPGIKHFQITMVNQSSQQVWQSWMLVLSCQKPSVTKAFQVHLSIGKESAKRISYSNSSLQEKHYVVYSSHPRLLLFRENQFFIPSGKSYCLGLYFPPQEAVFTDTIFLYLNDSADKNEETYCIKVICQ